VIPQTADSSSQRNFGKALQEFRRTLRSSLSFRNDTNSKQPFLTKFGIILPPFDLPLCSMPPRLLPLAARLHGKLPPITQQTFQHLMKSIFQFFFCVIGENLENETHALVFVWAIT
jgi:hypothetical protein